MNDAPGLRTLVAIGMEMGHDVMAQLLFVRLGSSKINVLDVGSQFVELCQRLRQDSHELRQRLATALNENRVLEEKISNATSRRGPTAAPGS